MSEIELLESGRGATYSTVINTDVGTYLLIVTATGPEGVKHRSVFNIIVSPDCTLQVVNPANLEA